MVDKFLKFSESVKYDWVDMILLRVRIINKYYNSGISSLNTSFISVKGV